MVDEPATTEEETVPDINFPRPPSKASPPRAAPSPSPSPPPRPRLPLPLSSSFKKVPDTFNSPRSQFDTDSHEWTRISNCLILTRISRIHTDSRLQPRTGRAGTIINRRSSIINPKARISPIHTDSCRVGCAHLPIIPAKLVLDLIEELESRGSHAESARTAKVLNWELPTEHCQLPFYPQIAPICPARPSAGTKSTRAETRRRREETATVLGCTPASLRLCARSNSLSHNDLHRSVGILWKGFSVVAS